MVKSRIITWSMKMNRAERKLVKQDVESPVTPEKAPPPPITEGPDLSETLRLLERISRLPDIRFDRVQKMRDLIASGQFETEERIRGTVRRILEEFGL
jgi:hypothetical protein